MIPSADEPSIEAPVRHAPAVSCVEASTISTSPLKAERGAEVAHHDDAWALAISSRVARHDRQAIAELYEARYAILFHRVRQRTACGDDFACDCVQDAWLRILRGMPVFRTIATMDAWLLRVVISCALDQIKSQRARSRRESVCGSVASGADSDRLLKELSDEVGRLGADEREVLILRVLRGRPLATVAEALGIKLRAAESRLRRAMLQLRKSRVQSGEGVRHDQQG